MVRGLLLLLLLAVAIPGAHGGIYGFWKWFRGALTACVRGGACC